MTSIHLTMDGCKQRTGGQGVRREAESEGHAEKFQAVIKRATSTMNWSAKDRERSSPQYGDEGILIRSIVPRCLQAAWNGRSIRDPGRTRCVFYRQ